MGYAIDFRSKKSKEFAESNYRKSSRLACCQNCDHAINPTTAAEFKKKQYRCMFRKMTEFVKPDHVCDNHGVVKLSNDYRNREGRQWD